MFSSSTVLWWMPLSLLSLLGGGGGVAGVDGLTGELMLLFCSSSGQSLFEKILKKKIYINNVNRTLVMFNELTEECT